MLEDGQNRAFEDGRVRAPDPRPPLAATTAAHDGDFTQRVGPHHRNRQFSREMRGLGRVENKTADQLPLFTGEVPRVAREADAGSRPGGRAKVPRL
ncbi:hypothetical protein AB0L42_35755 [Streptomyces sp. NPDC052287]|uniref:hypothetical protein n=1 Tax=Streptomyces sp. NPDC052287 TaxID=3154950 RepID=UPI00342E39C9